MRQRKIFFDSWWRENALEWPDGYDLEKLRLAFEAGWSAATERAHRLFERLAPEWSEQAMLILVDDDARDD